MNTHDSHLSERAIEAIACGREDLASESEREHAARCETCGAQIAATANLSAGTSELFLRAAPEPNPAELEAWVARALSKPAAESGEAGRALPENARPAVPRRSPLWAAAAAFAVVAADLLSRGVPSLGGGLRFARDTGSAAYTLTGVLFGLVPGGRASVLIAGAGLIFLLTLLSKRIASDGPGNFARAARRMFGVGLFTLTALLIGWVPAGSVHALDFQGDWDQAERPVTLTVERATASEVLRRAAAAAGVNLIATLPDDPQVTLAVTAMPLREVVAAVLGDMPVVAKLTGTTLVIQRASATAMPAAAPAAQPTPIFPPAPRVRDRDEDDDDDDRRDRKRKVRDQVTMGEDIVIAPGQRVKDVITMGGNADVAGEVLGSVVTMGGAAVVRKTANVRGDLITLGGEITVEDGAVVEGSRVGFFDHDDRNFRSWAHSWKSERPSERSWFGGLLARVAHYALLFLLGMILLNLAPDRMSALERTLVRAPGRSLALGSVGFLATLVTIVVLAITIIGIPAALVLAIALPVAVYLGLAAIAATLGAAIPFEAIQRSNVAQLASGVGILFLLSLIPFLGTIGLIIAATVGLGAVLLTRFSKQAFGEAV